MTDEKYINVENIDIEGLCNNCRTNYSLVSYKKCPECKNKEIIGIGLFIPKKYESQKDKITEMFQKGIINIERLKMGVTDFLELNHNYNHNHNGGDVRWI